MCFCDAMLQHPEAILCPVHKVTKDRGGGGNKSNLTITVLKKEGCGIRWFHMLSQSGRSRTGLRVKDTEVHVHFGCTEACAGLVFITCADGVCLTDTKLAEPYF